MSTTKGSDTPKAAKGGLAAAFEITEYPELKKSTAVALRDAKAIVIKDDKTQALAAEAGVQVTTLLKNMEARRVAIKAPIIDAGRRLDELFAEMMDPLKVEKTRLKTALDAYAAAKRREQERIDREASEAAEREEEKQRKALLKRAERAEESGKDDKAAALREQAESVTVIPVQEAVETGPVRTASGSAGQRKVWKYEVVDPNLLRSENGTIARAAKTIIPDSYWTLNETAISALKGKGVDIPGVRFYQEEETAFRGR